MNATEVNAIIFEIWKDIEQADMARIEREAKANPEKHRASSVIERGKPTRYHYYEAARTAADIREGRYLRFCYSKHRNVAGFYITWAEVLTGMTGRREGFRGHETKAEAMEYALARKRDAEKPTAERKWLRPKWEARRGRR